jgi:AcrR family transcriptional regulator
MRRPHYHHGDLANALTAAATQLAREGGPDAVVLREAARQVGVSATAAYRHFANHGDLMHAVKHQAAEQLADRMRIELARTPALDEPGPESLRQLRALGHGYLRFALDEPGLFRSAFCQPDHDPAEPQLDLALAAPFQMLVDRIDSLVDNGILAPARRPWAEMFAWAAVHGLAMLFLDGPLGLCTPTDQDEVIERVLEGVLVGLTAQ